MKTSSKALLAAAGVLVVAAVLFMIFDRPAPSPTDQILAQIEVARSAAERHSAGGVMSIISADYKDDNGYNVDRMHALLIEALRNEGKLTVTVDQPVSVTVSGDTATSTCQIAVAGDGSDQQANWAHELTLQWHRESVKKYLIWPSEEWLVTGASYGESPDGQ